MYSHLSACDWQHDQCTVFRPSGAEGSKDWRRTGSGLGHWLNTEELTIGERRQGPRTYQGVARREVY